MTIPTWSSLALKPHRKKADGYINRGRGRQPPPVCYAIGKRICTACGVESSLGAGCAGDHREGWTRGTSLPFQDCIPPPHPQQPWCPFYAWSYPPPSCKPFHSHLLSCHPPWWQGPQALWFGTRVQILHPKPRWSCAGSFPTCHPGQGHSRYLVIKFT